MLTEATARLAFRWLMQTERTPRPLHTIKLEGAHLFLSRSPCPKVEKGSLYHHAAFTPVSVVRLLCNTSTMPTSWITLPHTWTLQDTQAGLNVIIAFLCAGGIFVLVRYFWVSAARRVASDKEVPVYSLLSLNTIGETLDVIWLLRKDLFTGRYLGLLVQCICVLLLTVCALLSGFIARFSARHTTVLVPRNISGTLASRSLESTYFSGMETSAALTALRSAAAPQDRLFDFWPDPASQWRFAQHQWSNYTWGLSCKYTPLTALTENLRAINTSCDDDFSRQLPFLNDIWDDKARNYSIRYGINTWRDDINMTRNGIVFGFGDQLPDSAWDESAQLYTNMNFRMAMLFLDGPVYDVNYTQPGYCMFEVGPLFRAAYTKAECELTRNTDRDKNRTDDEVENWGAFPEADHTRVLDVLLEYYGNSWYREIWSGKPVTTIDGRELALFYQAYCITRDTKGFLYDNTSNIATVSRLLDVPMRAPQVSLACVVVCSIGAALVLAGLLNYLSFLFVHRKRLDRTPQSKLDWMLQTLRQDNERGQGVAGLRHRLHGHIGLGISHHQPELVELSKADDFETAAAPRSHGPASSISSVHSAFSGAPPPPSTPTSYSRSMHHYQKLGYQTQSYEAFV